MTSLSSPQLSLSLLRIAYINVRGLHDEKWHYLCSMIDDGSFDLIFIAETWFIHHLDRLSHPFLLSYTPEKKPSSISLTSSLPLGRKQGGMYLLISPKWKSLVCATHVHSNYIKIMLALYDNVKITIAG